jgi:hypothetical protein
MSGAQRLRERSRLYPARVSASAPTRAPYLLHAVGLRTVDRQLFSSPILSLNRIGERGCSSPANRQPRGPRPQRMASGPGRKRFPARLSRIGSRLAPLQPPPDWIPAFAGMSGNGGGSASPRPLAEPRALGCALKLAATQPRAWLVTRNLPAPRSSPGIVPAIHERRQSGGRARHGQVGAGLPRKQQAIRKQCIR